MELNWQAAGVLLAYITAGQTFMFFMIRSVVKSEISDAIKAINGTYRRGPECKLIHAEVDRRLESAEASIRISFNVSEADRARARTDHRGDSRRLDELEARS